LSMLILSACVCFGFYAFDVACRCKDGMRAMSDERWITSLYVRMTVRHPRVSKTVV
jgi:hypothetical protein